MTAFPALARRSCLRYQRGEKEEAKEAKEVGGKGGNEKMLCGEVPQLHQNVLNMETA